MKDSSFYSSYDVKNTTYLSLVESYKDNGFLVNDFYQIIFLIDENLHTTTRTVYNLIDALTDTGGLASVITLIFTILTMKIQRLLYYQDIMEKFFLYLDSPFSNGQDLPSKKLKKMSTNSVENQIIDRKQRARSIRHRFCIILRQFMNLSNVDEASRKYLLAKKALEKRMDVMHVLKKLRSADAL